MIIVITKYHKGKKICVEEFDNNPDALEALENLYDCTMEERLSHTTVHLEYKHEQP